VAGKVALERLDDMQADGVVGEDVVAEAEEEEHGKG
jgi:hypothetical protein